MQAGANGKVGELLPDTGVKSYSCIDHCSVCRSDIKEELMAEAKVVQGVMCNLAAFWLPGCARSVDHVGHIFWSDDDGRVLGILTLHVLLVEQEGVSLKALREQFARSNQPSRCGIFQYVADTFGGILRVDRNQHGSCFEYSYKCST